MLNFEESEKKLSKDEFFEFENNFHRKFPDSFRCHYLKNNGGYFSGNKVRALLFSGFIPIKYGKVPIEVTYQDLVEEFPELMDIVPFADDENGNCFLISLREEDYGEIYIWLMDEKKLAFVSKSFDDFINKLL